VSLKEQFLDSATYGRCSREVQCKIKPAKSKTKEKLIKGKTSKGKPAKGLGELTIRFIAF